MLLKSIVEWKQWSGFNADSGSSASSAEISSQGSGGTQVHDDDDRESRDDTSDAGSESGDNDPTANALIAYAATYWHQHLAALDLAAMRPEDNNTIAPLLIRLFRDRSIIWVWIEDVEDFSQKWLETKENVQLVYRWLQYFLTQGVLPREAADWVRGLTQDSVEDLLAVTMDELAKDWLENKDSTWSGSTVFEWLKTYTEEVSIFSCQLTLVSRGRWS